MPKNMPKNFGPLNLNNVFYTLRDKERLSSRRLFEKFSSLTKKGTKIVYFVRDKFDRNFGAGTNIYENEVQLSELPVNRPKSCHCNKPKDQPIWHSKISEISSTARNSLTKRSREPSSVSQRDIQDDQDPTKKMSPLDEPENLASIVEEELNLPNEPEIQSTRVNSLLNGSGILPESDQLDEKLKSPTPTRQLSLDEQRKSSIKSHRTSLPLIVEPTEVIESLQTKMSALRIEEIEENVEKTEIPAEETKEIVGEIGVDKVDRGHERTGMLAEVEEEQPIDFETVDLSRRDFEKLRGDSHIRRVIRIDHKNLPPDIEDSSALPAGEKDVHNEWRDVPAPVIEEIRRLTKSKRPHKCPKACPCKFTQELVNVYHESKLLSAKADKINEVRDHCTLRMTNSEVDFFKQDTKMCNVMIGETQSRRAEMRELMDMWQEANEKLTIRKKEIFSIVESIERTVKRIDDVEYLLKDWLPEGRMEKLRNAQRAIEKEDQQKIEALEDEARDFSKERIEDILKKRENWQEAEKIREAKRSNQRQHDMQTLQNATSLMQKYIDERKALLLR